MTFAIVSWNTRRLLERCLRSLAPEVEAGRADVWVVDNGSSDGSPELVREQAPWARLLRPEENVGFGRGVNLVARKTEQEWLAAANADVALEPGALDALLKAGAEPRVGAIAPRLVLPDGRTQHSVYHFPTVPFTLAFNLGLPQRSRRLGDRLCLEGSWDPSRARTVGWAIGAFLLLRREAFDAVGGFDEDQWIYAEDLDLAWRLGRAGWTIRYEPTARVLHHSSAATTAAFGDAKANRFMAATYASLLRRRGLLHTWAIAAINVAGAAGRLAWFTPLAGRSARRRAARDANRRWLHAHLQGLRSPSRLLGQAAPGYPHSVGGPAMASFWDERASDDAVHFVDTRQRYGDPDLERFFAEGARDLEAVLEALGARLEPGHSVVEIGCGVGRFTRALSRRAAHVVAVDVSERMLACAQELNPGLRNVEWRLGDGVSLAGLDDRSADACVSAVVFLHMPDPQITLGYVREVGRVLKPGGWAALHVSNDPAVHPPRGGLRSFARGLPRGSRWQRHPAWRGSAVDLGDLRRVAADSGLELERVLWEGTPYCCVLLRRTRA